MEVSSDSAMTDAIVATIAPDPEDMLSPFPTCGKKKRTSGSGQKVAKRRVKQPATSKRHGRRGGVKGRKSHQGTGKRRKYKIKGRRHHPIEYGMMIKRAVLHTQSCAGTTKKAIIKFIRKRFNVNEKLCAKNVRRWVKTMLKYGYLYRNKKNPEKLKVTKKGFRQRTRITYRRNQILKGHRC